ncbi:MAG: AAA family ATPase [Bacilli bacterium]|nr:AAA family ATPase [Bacilli bacterium]
MMKILIVGIVASGKTTLAKKLSKLLGIKHYEIDSVVHDDVNNVKRSEKEQKKIFNEINREDNWIIEGTLRKHLFYLCNMADKIIYLDIPLNIRKRRIFTRFIKQLFGTEQSNYEVNLKMLKMMYKWTDDFEKNRSDFERQLFTYSDKIIIVDDLKLML